MRHNLTLLGFLFLFLAYLIVSEKRDELQMRWNSELDQSTLSDFSHDDDTLKEPEDIPGTLSI